MELITKAPRGTSDVLPKECAKWQYIEEIVRKTTKAFNYKEIKFPTFEHTELFERGVGQETDVVQKEMYTFLDKSNRSITLRPEGTAGAVRLMLENGLYGGVLPLKYYYLISCFRYEKPQAGRLREFHQFGVELFGSCEPQADAEVISLANEFLNNLKLKNIILQINSIGCKDCREKYINVLKKYFEQNKANLCETCLNRLNKNPMRILDCKIKQCGVVSKKAPVGLDYICQECNAHFEAVKQNLTAMNISFEINEKIVRGLDYYNRTVFEFISNEIGAQGTVCGGGRYDGLAYELAKENISGLGFAIGLERIILLMTAQDNQFKNSDLCDVFVANIGDMGSIEAVKLVNALRKKMICAEYDILGRSLKAQMKYADKISAKYTLVLGENEINEKKAQLKNMQTGEKTTINIENITEIIKMLR